MSSQTPTSDAPFLVVSPGFYNSLKLVAQVILPGLATLYFAIAGIWGLPAAEQVVGTVTALDLFLGLLVARMSGAYHASGAGLDGQMVVDPERGYLLPSKSPEQMRDQKTVTFEVVKPVPQPEESEVLPEAEQVPPLD